MRFKNSKTGEVVDIHDPIWPVVLIFGGFYFLYKKMWINAIISIVFAFMTVGFSWFIYPFFSKALIRWEYKQRGWLDTSDGFGDVEINGMHSKDVLVTKDDLNVPYSKIAKISAISYKLFPIGPDPTRESIDEKLRDEAVKLGANAVINVEYKEKKYSIAYGRGKLEGNAWAVKINNSESK
jgi:hypothetical protein